MDDGSAVAETGLGTDAGARPRPQPGAPGFVGRPANLVCTAAAASAIVAAQPGGVILLTFISSKMMENSPASSQMPLHLGHWSISTFFAGENHFRSSTCSGQRGQRRGSVGSTFFATPARPSEDWWRPWRPRAPVHGHQTRCRRSHRNKYRGSCRRRPSRATDFCKLDISWKNRFGGLG